MPGWECHHIRAKTRLNANYSLFKDVFQPFYFSVGFHLFNSSPWLAGKYLGRDRLPMLEAILSYMQPSH